MEPQQFLYLFSVIFFPAVAIAIRWKKRQSAITKYWPVIIFLTLISIPFMVLDLFAVRWRAWDYLPTTSLQIVWGAEIETLLFAALVTFVVATAVVAAADRVDKKQKLRK